MLAACGSGGSSHVSSAPRTVTVNWVDTYWSPSGPVQAPEPAWAALNIEALVPQKDGSITLLKASATSAPGVFTIANVPAGNYWLAAGNGGAFWTNTATFDAGSDIAGGQYPSASSQNTISFNYDISGIAPETTEEWIVSYFFPLSLVSQFSLDPGSTSLSDDFALPSSIDWSEVHSEFLMQYELEPLGPLNNYVLGPELTLSNLTLTEGATNSISGTLNPATETSFNLGVSGSQWASVFNNVGPAMATVQNSVLTLTAEPYVVGLNAGPSSVDLPALLLVAPTPGGTALLYESNEIIIDPLVSICEDFTGAPPGSVLVNEPPVLTDQNFGVLQYSDPFDPTWTRALALCQQATVPIPIPNSSETYSFVLEDGASVAPSNSPLAPIALPVENPAINGSSFFTASTADTVTPTLTWTAPTGAAPYGYRIGVYLLITSSGLPAAEPIAIYNTAGTSVTLPPLNGGNTYIFTITTEVDGAANMQTSPYRSALPAGFASVVSAPITISPSAATPQIEGDIEEWRRLVTPKPHFQGQAQEQPRRHVSCSSLAGSQVRAYCE